MADGSSSWPAPSTSQLPAPSARPSVARLVSIPELARARGMPYRTLHRQLSALAARDAADARPVDWIGRANPRGKLQVNLSRLRAAHPLLFDAKAISRAELAGIDAQFHTLRERQRRTALALRSIADRVRQKPEKPCALR